MKKILFTLLLFAGLYMTVTSMVIAQDTTSPDDSKPKHSTFTFGKGVGINPPDSTFSMNIKFIMQNQLILDHNDGEFSKIVARVRRMRLKFDGFLYNPKLTYVFQIGFSPTDLANDIKPESSNALLDAMVYYQVTPSFSLGLGQTVLPGNRQYMISAGKQQFVDRSIVNKVFNLERDYGLHLKLSNNLGGDIYYNLLGTVTSGEGRNWTGNTKSGLSYLGRVELLPLGKFSGGGDYSEGDLKKETSPKVSIGLAYNRNVETSRDGGQQGDLLFDNRDINSVFVDLMFKYQGFAITTEYAQRTSDDPITIDPDDDANVAYIYDGAGFNYQMSYLFGNNYEIAGKYSQTNPSDEINNMVNKAEEYAIGLNKYIKGHTIKLQADMTYHVDTNELTSDSEDYWEYRFQITLGI